MQRDLFDVHVVPTSQLGFHPTEPHCWCTPVVNYEHPVTHGRLWVHRKANDAPHYEKEAPRDAPRRH